MRSKTRLTLLVLAVGLLWATSALAQALPTPNAGFDITGFIQRATVSGAATATSKAGGDMTVNGRFITIPKNLIVQMPAASFKWAALFDPTVSFPVGTYTPPRLAQPAGQTGLALMDPLANHFPSYEVRVVGNIIRNPATGKQQYIAAMILPATQQGLNGQSGYINYIDYTGAVLGGGTVPGRFRVGGTMNDPTTGTLCELNDPVGRFGVAHSPDPRFTADTNNPTITAATGYPVGIPNVAPTAIPLPAGETGDLDRPYTNRPPNGGSFGSDPFLNLNMPLKAFTMPAVIDVVAGSPDPRLQVPLMVGDWVDVSGTIFKINPGGDNTPANQFLSVHSLTAHLGIKTAPGTDPAYVRVEEFLFGVGDGSGTGPTVAGIAQETSNRAVLVAFTTDSDRALPQGSPGLPGGALYGIYVDPAGTEIPQPFPNGSTVASPPSGQDPFEVDDPIRGRMRWQVNKNANPPGSKTFIPNSVGPGKFYREYVLQLTHQANPAQSRAFQLPNQNGGTLGGLIAGQYRLPIFDYIFGEGTDFGQPWPPFNFNDFGFLVTGEGPNVGPLNPFPAFQ
jgi:hypothetical protein